MRELENFYSLQLISNPNTIIRFHEKGEFASLLHLSLQFLSLIQ